MTPAGLPPPEQHAHGTRARYVAARCRCDDCRRANREYARQRAVARARDGWNGTVDAAPVLEHLRALSRQGVGYKAVADACDVPRSTLSRIRGGSKRNVRKSTADRVLAVTREAIADHALIAAAPTWRLIAQMQRAGFTRREIARRLLGHEAARKLQIGRVKILARTALAVKWLHAEVMRELALEKSAAAICDECGYSHAREDRIRVLLRMLPCSSEQIRAAHPCWWDGPKHSARERMLYRDLRSVHAVLVDGLWTRRTREAAVATEAA